MREEIDFQDYDIVGDGFDDELAARLRPVHREELPEVITGCARVKRSHMATRGILYRETFMVPCVSSELLSHEEVAIFEGTEPSWIATFTEKVQDSGLAIDSPQFVRVMEKPVRAMMDLLCLPFELIYVQMSVALLRDILDKDIYAYADEEDHWRWSKRYARLYELAKTHNGEFRIFRRALDKFWENFPDIIKKQETPKEKVLRREKELKFLRKEFERRNPGFQEVKLPQNPS